MTSKERLEMAWSFQEPDRVPIELRISPNAYQHPGAQRVRELIEQCTDNFHQCAPYDWGFLGLPATYSEKEIERKPGEFVRIERTYDTCAGPFTAIVREPDFEGGAIDCHWEKRYITCPEDMERLTEASFEVRELDAEELHRTVAEVGDKGIVLVSVLHPLGWLVRNATMEEVYIWFKTHRELMHRFLEVTNEHVAGGGAAMLQAGIGPYFAICAHEMLIPPWAGSEFFEEFVFEYDKRVNDVIHAHGGKLRAHCHGNAMEYLERFWEMGIDSVEPLEAAPMGDVDLAEAKRRVGDRMLLSGNIPSPYFPDWSREQVEQSVREAIEAGAAGGGFSLRTTGGTAGTGAVRNFEQLGKILANCEAYLLAGLKYGSYSG